VTAATAWRIQHIELGGELPDLERSPRHAGLTVILWLHGMPLGRLEYLDAELPVPASALAAAVPHAIAPAVGDRLFGRGFEGALPVHGRAVRATPDIGAILHRPGLLEALRDTLALPPPPPEGAGLSVIICTRDRPEHLARCLDSLEPGLPWIGEIIVVDNGSRPEATRSLVAKRSKARYVAEPRPGLSLARNTGVRQARHDILAFTDDDVVVHPDWPARILAGFATPETMCVTGLVLPTELETEAQVVFERDLGGFGQGLQRMAYDTAFFERMLPYGVPVWRIGAGANMAIRRSALKRVGGFDERLGAGAAGCSEDSELWYRLLAAGWTCRYEPAAVVFHEHRREWQQLRKQMHDYMRGHVAALLVQYAQHRHPGNLRRLAFTVPGHYARLLARAVFHRRFSGRSRLIGTELRGVLSGIGAIRWAGTKDGPPLSRPGEAAP
jgi:GT2 family glycosyltransferase